jgi:hypothetical protein
VQAPDDRANERRFSRTERPAEADDVTRPQRRPEIGRESFKRRAIVEDVILRSQNIVWCVCA